MNEERLKQLLRAAMPAVGDAKLKRDLWPEMRPKIDQQTLRVSAFDWALIAAVLVWAVMFPEGLLALLYHL